MKIAINIGHPGHVHFYKNFIWGMEKRGHTIYVISKDRDMAIKLLDRYDIDYYKVSSKPRSNKLPYPISYVGYLKFEKEIYHKVKELEPDICTGIGIVGMAHVAKLLDIDSVVFTDNEDRHVKGNKISMPLADIICTPSKLNSDYGAKQLRYPGYHELAYLHPNIFTPNQEELEKLGIDLNEKYFVLRFVAWKAVHDMNQKGFSLKEKRKLIKKLKEHGRVYITSESELAPEFEKYRLPIPPHLIHDFLYHADLYLGDSQTMATESALLGVPAIRCNSFVGENDMSNFIELENKYKLLYNFSDADKAIKKATELAQEDGIKKTWKKRLDELLEDKINVTKFMINLFEKLESRI